RELVAIHFRIEKIAIASCPIGLQPYVPDGLVPRTTCKVEALDAGGVGVRIDPEQPDEVRVRIEVGDLVVWPAHGVEQGIERLVVANDVRSGASRDEVLAESA